MLIETEDRRPVLIERPSESGLALVLNERLDGEDSNLPFQPAFVMLMRRIVDWLDAGRTVPERVVVGETVALPVNVQVLDPSGEALVALADTARAQTLRTDAPGIYTVIGALGEQTLEVVLDPGESDLATLTDMELADWLARHDGSSSAADRGDDAAQSSDGDEAGTATAPSAATSDETTPPSGSARERAERLVLWPLLLPLLAVLLLAETLFANRRLDVRREGT